MHGESHYRPWEILRLTEAEICAALDDDVRKPRPPSWATPVGDLEEMAHLDYLRRRTARQALEDAMEDE